MKEIELIFLWCNIDDINGRNLKLLFLFHSFTSNNLCLSRLRSPSNAYAIHVCVCVCVCVHGQLHLNEWINLDCMREERKNWLAFPSSLFEVITDGAWLQWTSRRRFNVVFSTLSLSLSLPLWRESCCYIVSCSWPGLLGLFSRSDDSVPVCT